MYSSEKLLPLLNLLAQQVSAQRCGTRSSSADDVTLSNLPST